MRASCGVSARRDGCLRDAKSGGCRVSKICSQEIKQVSRVPCFDDHPTLVAATNRDRGSVRRCHGWYCHSGAVADDNVTTLDESATERTAAKPGWITNKSPMKDLSAGTWAEFVGPQDPGVRPERCSLPPDLNLAAMDSSSSTTQMSGRVFPIG